MFPVFDPLYFLILAPALLLAGWAQMRVRSAYSHGMQEPANLSGAAAARYILDEGGLHDVPVEEVPGELTDHYDPRDRVVRLSSGVYHSRTLAAVGIAAHEVGHALQHAHNYGPMALRSFAVPAATVGPWVFMVMLFAGMFVSASAPAFGMQLIWIGIIAYSAVAVFQIINLPVEFDASNRAKRLLGEMQIVDSQGAAVVRSVLNAAAWTYVAATLQAVLTVLYYAIRVGGLGSSRDD